MSPETQLAIRDYSMFLGYHHVILNLDPSTIRLCCMHFGSIHSSLGLTLIINYCGGEVWDITSWCYRDIWNNLSLYAQSDSLEGENKSEIFGFLAIIEKKENGIV